MNVVIDEASRSVRYCVVHLGNPLDLSNGCVGMRSSRNQPYDFDGFSSWMLDVANYDVLISWADAVLSFGPSSVAQVSVSALVWAGCDSKRPSPGVRVAARSGAGRYVRFVCRRRRRRAKRPMQSLDRCRNQRSAIIG